MQQNLVLFPGWGYTAEVMQPLAKALSAQYQVTVIDLSKPINEIIAGIPANSIFIGWSLGGLFALKLANFILTQKIILIASNPCFISNDNWPGVNADTFTQFSYEFNNAPETALQKFAYLQAQGLPDERKAYKEIKTYLAKDNNNSMLLNILKTDMREQLKKINCPIQFILGAKDPLVPIALADKIKDIKPEAQVSILEDAGHVPVLFNIEALINHVN